MNEEEIKKMQEENSKLKEENESLKKTTAENTEAIEELKNQIKEKEDKIIDMGEKFKEQGRNFKKLRDMTKEEKELLTDKERELMERQEKLDEDLNAFKKNTEDFNAKQRNSVIDNLVDRISKGDKEVGDQVRANLERLNPEQLSAASTEAELTPFVEGAYNMLGLGKTDALRTAHNHGGQGGYEERKTDDFSNTDAGKNLANAMGLSQTKVDTNNNNNENNQ